MSETGSFAVFAVTMMWLGWMALLVVWWSTRRELLYRIERIERRLSAELDKTRLVPKDEP